MPSIICSELQPALAISVIASATSLALKAVSAPSSIAFSLKASNSSPVAPEIALTSDIPFSKSVATFNPAVPIPSNGTVTLLVRVEPAEVMLLPAL